MFSGTFPVCRSNFWKRNFTRLKPLGKFAFRAPELNMKQFGALRGRQWPNFKFKNIFSECFLDIFRGFPSLSEHRRDTLEALEHVGVISEEKISLDSNYLENLLSELQSSKWSNFELSEADNDQIWNLKIFFRMLSRWYQGLSHYVRTPERQFGGVRT